MWVWLTLCALALLAIAGWAAALTAQNRTCVACEIRAMNPTRTVASEEGGPAEAERVGYAPADQPPSSHSRERREHAQPTTPISSAVGVAPLERRPA